jgi:cytochrome c5
MFTGMLHTHTLVVVLFLLIYVVKTILLFSSRPALDKFSARIKLPEMIISFLFLATGLYLAFNSGDINAWFWAKIGAVALSIPIAVIAFKRKIKVLAVLSVLLIVYAYGVSETRSAVFSKKNISEAFSGVSEADLGKSIYDSQCKMCHGDNGKLGLSGSKDLTVSEKSKVEKIEIIKKGKNAMIGYEKILSEVEIIAVADYVETLE